MIAKAMLKSWEDIKRYRYLLIASAAIVIAISALLYMQYRAVKRTQEHAQKTMKANLELHLFEIAEEAKRKILDHANHIMHAVRQQRIRERNIPSIERALTRLTKRYPEVEDCFVVFFERGQESETWQALKFVRPDENDPNVQTYEGVPVGRMVEDNETSQSLRRAWVSIPNKESQTTLYTAFDPERAGNKPRQYFFHTVYELDRLKRNTPLENIGLLVFSANPNRFPSKSYLQKLVAKHQERDKEIDGLIGKLDYTVTLTENGAVNNLVNTNEEVSMTMSRRFDESDKLFPNLTFGVSSPDIETKTYYNEYAQTSIFLGVVAIIAAVFGIGLAWRATQREMKVAQVKSDFLANISHELKTPLTAIRAFGDLLHSGRANKTERIREYGGIIKTESDRLTALINNILEMSRMERGVRKYRLEKGDLRETITATVEIFRHSIDKIQISSKLSIQPVFTRFDEGAIRQAVINLLSNAVKYSGKNQNSHIQIELKKEASMAIIEVRDFGIGISKEEQRDIFLPFHRSISDEIQAKGGTGLGLAIVREIARGHGGDVSVESEIGKGSIFSIHLPILSDAKQFDKELNEDGTYFGYRRRA